MVHASGHDVELLTNLTSDIVSAFVGNNSVAASEVPGLISTVFTALASLEQAPPAGAIKLVPAVPIRASVKHDYIVCLEDGKKVQTLKRHLLINHGMTVEEYRERWGLPADYLVIAPGYTERRRKIATESGLGRQPRYSVGRRKKG